MRTLHRFRMGNQKHLGRPKARLCLPSRLLATAPFPDPRHEFKSRRVYQGKLKAVVLDWAGTVLDCGVYSPAVVFQQVFESEGVPITMAEARGPMGAHKQVHIRKLTQMPTVRRRWEEKHGKLPDESDVERMFEKFVPAQIACLGEYSAVIPGAVETVNWLKAQDLKIGGTTGFTRAMVDVLAADAKKQGYDPDFNVAADEVPAARPFPFMVWQNAIMLEASPIASVVKVDDTVDGVREGVNAGCWAVGLAETGNYMGMNEAELASLKQEDPILYAKMLEESFDKLSSAGAHYVVTDITGLPAIVDDINRRLALGESP